MRNCIFCKIIAGEIPAVKLYEDELVLAFLDISPINFGHTLVIPKEHHTSVATIPEATGGRMFRVGSRLGVAMRRALDCDGFNLHLSDGTVAGQVVMHAHLHIGFHWNWRQLKYASDQERSELAEKLIRHFKLETQPGDAPAEAENTENENHGA